MPAARRSRSSATKVSIHFRIKENVASQRLSFFLHAGVLDPIAKSVSESRMRLAERRFPAYYREMQERGREYLTRVEMFHG